MNAMTLSCNNCAPARQTGLSLVELMISLTIGLVLLLGISTLIAQQNSTRSEMEKSSRQIENGRYAIQLLHDDIQLAGFYGDYSPPTGVATAIPVDPCDTTPANLGWNAATPQVPVAIFGYADATAPNFPTCLESYQPNTAVLVIRRTSTISNPVAAAVAGTTTFLQVSNCAAIPVEAPFVLGTGGFNLRQRGCAITTDPAVCTAIDPATGLANTWRGLSCLRPYIVRIYYISSCSVCGTDSIPTLTMVEFVGGARRVVPLVEGIENMQFDYGIDTTGARTLNVDATCINVVGGGGDGAPDNYATPPAATDWPNVTAVRINLLARNNDTTASHNDTKTYNLGGAGTVGPFNDTYKRHAYSQLVRAINPSGRREPCI